MGIREEMREVKDEIRFCDECGATDRFDYGAGGSCALCLRDVCGRCSVPDPDDSGDYPTHWCKHCWSIGASFRERIEQECIHHEVRCGIIRDEWKTAALRAMALPTKE